MFRQSHIPSALSIRTFVVLAFRSFESLANDIAHHKIAIERIEDALFVANEKIETCERALSESTDTQAHLVSTKVCALLSRRRMMSLRFGRTSK